MAVAVSFIKAARLTHLHLGVFISPAVLFFAITGALQTFQLQSASKGGHYKPPRALAILAQIHKNQTPILKLTAPAKATDDEGDTIARKETDAHVGKAGGQTHLAEASSTAQVAAEPEERHPTLPLKIFFLLVSISLVTSTASGIYMTYKYRRNKLLIGGMLLAGVVLPVIFTIY